ncbi:MAG: fibrinogen-like YCDxxxxGGGW domain-containing protein [Myxococcota bacterium]
MRRWGSTLGLMAGLLLAAGCDDSEGSTVRQDGSIPPVDGGGSSDAELDAAQDAALGDAALKDAAMDAMLDGGGQDAAMDATLDGGGQDAAMDATLDGGGQDAAMDATLDGGGQDAIIDSGLAQDTGVAEDAASPDSGSLEDAALLDSSLGDGSSTDADAAEDAGLLTCSNGTLDGSETDTDCGGPECGACLDGQSCLSGSDCASSVCSGGLAGICTAAACDDGVQNGSETGVDCGGACGGCALSEGCVLDDDCQSTWCDGGSCTSYISCNEILLAGRSSGDGLYAIDPLGVGEAREMLCDMTTDGGGFTQVASFDPSAGDALADFLTLMTQLDNDMEVFQVVSDRLEWNAGGRSMSQQRAALAYRLDVDVPNDGEMIYELSYDADRLNGSGVWLYVESGAGRTRENLDCNDVTAGITGYSPEQLSLVPYACGNTDPPGNVTNWIWSRDEQRSAAEEVVSFHIVSLHADRGNDLSKLFSFALWVR